MASRAGTLYAEMLRPMKKIVIIFSVILLAVAGWFGLKLYRAGKEKRFAAQAERFLEANDRGKAILGARQALEINSNNVTACRVMAFFADAEGSPYAVEWRRRIAKVEPNLTNELMLASCALRCEAFPYPTASATLQKLAKEGSNLPEYHIVCSQLALQLNDPKSAENHLREAIKLDPKNQSCRLNLAALHLRSGDIALAAEARTTLNELTSSAEFASDALRWLRQDAHDRKDFAEAMKFSSEIIKRKDVRDADRLEHLTILLQSDNPQLAGYLKSIQNDAANDPFQVHQVAVWLITSEMPEKALRWVNSLPKTMQLQFPVPVARADALAEMKHWNELSDWLQEQDWKEQEFLRRALLARASRMLKEDEVAKALWNRAVNEATDKIESLARLEQLADQWGWSVERESVLWSIIQKFPEHIWALESINRIYEANRNTAGLLRVFETRLQKNSNDLVAKNNVAMISLLLKTNLSMAHTLADEVYKYGPTNWGYASTYAYSLHLQGKTEEAIKVLRALPKTEFEQPALAAYYVILLSAAGEKETARQFVELAERAEVLPEEKTLLEEAKKML